MSIYLPSFMHKAPLESLRAFLGDISVAASSVYKIRLATGELVYADRWPTGGLSVVPSSL